MSAKEQIIDFIKYILSAVCQNKDAISVEEKTDERGTVILISVADEDMGRLIGRGGQNIAAIRTLVRVMGARDNERISLKVVEKV